jgi:pimeloyl-ACP methyl ester carboxylesterase
MKIEAVIADGVFIEHVPSQTSPSGPPIVFVHGGLQGSWVWENYLPYFAERGYDTYAFSWFNRHGSHDLPDERFAVRSLADTVEELETVIAHVGQTPILITHSMGALVGQKYAEQHPVVAQVHITPAIAAEVGLHRDTEVDLTKPVDIPSFEDAWQRVFAGSPEEDACRFYALLAPESALAIKETLSTSLSVDRTHLSGPSLVIGAEHDIVVPEEAIRRSADYFGSDYLFLPGKTHNVLLEPGWRETAEYISTWLNRQIR